MPDDIQTRKELRQFFKRVLALDGPGELQRIHASFVAQFYKATLPQGASTPASRAVVKFSKKA